MSAIVKVTTVGSSVGIVLPKEILSKLHVEKGDSLYLTETPDGVQLTPYDEEFERQIDIGKKVMRKYRDALRKLAE
jgi:putative addiction module antidote